MSWFDIYTAFTIAMVIVSLMYGISELILYWVKEFFYRIKINNRIKRFHTIR
jgi:hypothetical protein